MNSTAFFFCAALAALMLAVCLFIPTGQAPPTETEPIMSPEAMAQYAARTRGKKACPDCGAIATRVAGSRDLNRCRVCGCEFVNGD